MTGKTLCDRSPDNKRKRDKRVITQPDRRVRTYPDMMGNTLCERSPNNKRKCDKRVLTKPDRRVRT